MNYLEAMVVKTVALLQYIYLFIFPLLTKIILYIVKHQILKKYVGGKIGLHQRNHAFLTLNVCNRMLTGTFPVASESVT